MVSAVNRALHDIHQALVSYNGTYFGLLLLEPRWWMPRHDSPFSTIPNIDLLYPARRLWKLRSSNCSLSTIEQRILGTRRDNDVPGKRVPQIYFDYHNNIQPGRILAVLQHHAQDIFSLAALLSMIQYAWKNPNDSGFKHVSDQRGLARMLISRNRVQDGLMQLEGKWSYQGNGRGEKCPENPGRAAYKDITAPDANFESVYCRPAKASFPAVPHEAG